MKYLHLKDELLIYTKWQVNVVKLIRRFKHFLLQCYPVPKDIVERRIECIYMVRDQHFVSHPRSDDAI